MIESTRLEEGVLIYERFLSEDGGKVLVLRKVRQLRSGNFAPAESGEICRCIRRLVKRERWLVFGTPNDELKRMLSGFDATFVRPMAGFSALDKDSKNDR